MNRQATFDNSLVLSYLGLRKAIGIIGTALPFVLALGKSFIESPGIEPSISAYYYTRMGDVLVGSLCAIAVFLMSYRGYGRADRAGGVLACVFGVGVALFPTTPEHPTPAQSVIGVLHLLSAAAFFLTLAYFSLALFRKTDSPGQETHGKINRNRVYTACGYTILACLAAIVVVGQLPDGSPVRQLDPLFWLESIAVVAFGVSWLTKGEAILKD